MLTILSPCILPVLSFAFARAADTVGSGAGGQGPPGRAL